MQVELINDQVCGLRVENPVEPVLIKDEAMLRLLDEEYESLRLALINECSKFGKKGFRADDDFDVTVAQVHEIGGRFRRYLDICVISRPFLLSPFLEAVKTFIDEQAPDYCVSIHTDPRMKWGNPRAWVFLWKDRVELQCYGWWTRARLKRRLSRM